MHKALRYWLHRACGGGSRFVFRAPILVRVLRRYGPWETNETAKGSFIFGNSSPACEARYKKLMTSLGVAVKCEGLT